MSKLKPIVYACSGCSNLAALANDIALNLERDGIAEMSCASGVVGRVKPMLELAESGRPIIALDGCAMGCTKACLRVCGVGHDVHVDLSNTGIEMRSNQKQLLNETCVAMKFVYESLFEAGYSLAQEIDEKPDEAD